MSAIEVPQPVQEAVAQIYQGVFRIPLEAFKETTLRRLAPVLPFASAVWGSGVHSTNEMLSVSMVDQPIGMLFTYAAHWQAHDFVREAAVAQPGHAFRNEDVMPLPDYHRTAIYREFSSPAGIEHALTIVQRNEATDLAEIVSLFRSAPDAPFTDAEKSLLEHLSPHLVGAWRQAQIAHHYKASANGSGLGFAEHEGYAVTDLQGLVHAAGEDFCLALREISPAWRGPRFPPELDPLVHGGHTSLALGRYEFSARRADDRRLFSVSRPAPAFGLTATETRVARLYAGGLSQRDIALRHGVSISTVRNQLASVYQKLEVHSKLELLRALNSPPS